MKYMNFNPQIHDANKIATLRYNVDFRTYDKLFSSGKKAVEALEKTLNKYRSLKVIYNDDDEIIGILVVYNYYNQPDFHFTPLKLFIVDILDHFVLCDIAENDLYLAEVAIDESQRGKGLGRKVVQDVLEYAKSKNYDRVILDADFRNKGAKRLYESLGFKVFNKKRVKIGGFERGMYNMEFTF